MGLTPGRRGVGNRGRGRQEGASSTFILRKYIRQGTKKAPKPHQQFHWEECPSETSWVPTPHTTPLQLSPHCHQETNLTTLGGFQGRARVQGVTRTWPWRPLHGSYLS